MSPPCRSRDATADDPARLVSSAVAWHVIRTMHDASVMADHESIDRIKRECVMRLVHDVRWELRRSPIRSMSQDSIDSRIAPRFILGVAGGLLRGLAVSFSLVLAIVAIDP